VCLGIFGGDFYFMLSVPVQLIAWEDHPGNDLLCIERDIKQLLTHSLTVFFVRSPVVDEEKLKPGHCLLVTALCFLQCFDTVGWCREGHQTCPTDRRRF